MILKPTSLPQLTEALAHANASGEKVTGVELSALNRILEHRPEDMTVTVECGMTLATLQAQLAQRGQWLPIDPPNPDELTIGELLAGNLSGPRRFGYGTMRDHLIGLKVALADGRIVKSGGKVVKNVAGFDVQKLFIGGHGTLGVTVEAVFKLRPLPEVEQWVQREFATVAEATALVEAVLQSPLTPVVLDLHRLVTSNSVTLVLGFAGTKAEVQWQLAQAVALGIQSPASNGYHATFWGEVTKPQRESVLPSRLEEALARLGNAPWLAHAGNGVIYYRGGPQPALQPPPAQLMQRVKDEFDPKHIFPELPA